MVKSILFVILLVLVAPLKGDYAPGCLLDDDLDILIYRLSARYGVRLPCALFFQPLNTKDLTSFLDGVAQSDSGRLSQTESFLLNKALEYYDPRNGLLKWFNEDENIHLRVYMNLLGDIRPVFSGESSVGVKGILGPLLTGNIGKLSFYSGVDVWTEYRSDTLFEPSSYQPYDGIAHNLYGRNTLTSTARSSDMLRGGIRYDLGRTQLETAIDYLKVGPALYYPLTLSGSAPPITYFRGSLDLGIMEYSHVAGLIRTQKDRSKYLYMHRLGTSLWNNKIDLGVNEVIVNGSSTSEPVNDSNAVLAQNSGQVRGWEWVYLIPFVPFKFAEHYAGDRDNAAISFDVNLNWPASFRWYAEFFLDDILSPWKIFGDDWGNKWALTAGTQYFGNAFYRDFMVNAEYSHVEPWVYTHFFGGSHRYSHYGSSLGSPLGPNSQAIALSMHSQINNFNQAGIGFSAIARNEKVRGGKITDVFQYADSSDISRFHDSTKKQFLGPGTQWSLRPGLFWKFNVFGVFRIDARYEVELFKSNGESMLTLQGGLMF